MNEQNAAITYEIKFSDVLYFAIYHQVRSPLMISVFIGTFFVRNMKLILSAIEDQRLPFSFVAMNLLVDGVIWLLFFFILLLVLAFFTFYSKKKDSQLTAYNLSLLQTSLVEESSRGKLEINYSAIAKLCNTNKYLFIYRTKTAGIIVPKRSFKSEAQWKDFYTVLMNKYKASNAA